MKTLLKMIIVLSLLSSCASNPVTKKVLQEREALEETIKEDKVIGDALPSWIYKSGIENGMVYAVGVAEFNADKSPFYIQKAALMDGETKLLSDAPADVRVVTQNVLTGVGIDSAEFYQIQTKLQEVIGITGIKHASEKTECRKVVRYGSLSTYVNRVCYVQVYIPLRNLMKAYQRTLAMKFGEYKSNEFANLMNKELEKIDGKSVLREKKDENNDNNNSALQQSANSTRLPAQQTRSYKRQQRLPSANNKGRYNAPSRNESQNSNAQTRSVRASKNNRTKTVY